MSTAGVDAAADMAYPSVAAMSFPPPSSPQAPASAATAPMFAFTLSPSSVAATVPQLDAPGAGAPAPLPPAFSFASPAPPPPTPLFTPFTFASPVAAAPPGSDAAPSPAAPPASFAILPSPSPPPPFAFTSPATAAPPGSPTAPSPATPPAAFALGAPSKSHKKKTAAKQAAKAEPKPAEPFTYSRPPRVTCTQAIQHAAQDGTQLYFSRLPPELCAELDSISRLRWCFEPVLYAVSLPAMPVGQEKITYGHLLWRNNEALSITASPFAKHRREALDLKATGATPPLTRIVFYSDNSPTRVVTIDDEFAGVMMSSTDRPPLLLYGGSYPHFGGRRLRDVEGNELHSWQDNSLAMRPPPDFLDGWAHSHADNTWTWLHELGTTYTLPPLSFWCRSWYAFLHDGEPHGYVAGDAKGGRRVHQVWKLKTQTLVWEQIVEDPMRGRLHMAQKAFVLTSAFAGKPPTIQIFSLGTGASLLSEVSGYWPGSGIYDRGIVLEHDQRSGSTITFWDPLVPEKVSVIDFRDWELVSIFHGVVIAKRGKDDVLLWHFDHGCGVRTPGLSLQAKVCYRASGAFIATCPDATYVIPMPVNREVRKRQPLPQRVPDHVPVFFPRKLRSGCDVEFPEVGLTPVLRHGSFTLAAPVFVHAGNLWVFG